MWVLWRGPTLAVAVSPDYLSPYMVIPSSVYGDFCASLLYIAFLHEPYNRQNLFFKNQLSRKKNEQDFNFNEAEFISFSGCLPIHYLGKLTQMHPNQSLPLNLPLSLSLPPPTSSLPPPFHYQIFIYPLTLTPPTSLL